MAGKVKKGFGTYMFILLLALVAAFLIVMLVMIFNPFKKVLGYQYVYYKDSEEFSNVKGGDTGTIFDLGSLEEIKVDCNYAEVTIVREYDLQRNKITIDHNIAGFASENADVDYSVRMYYQAGSNNKILCIDVEEPECMVYFAKRVAISIQLPRTDKTDFENTKINISNTSGNVNVGFGEAGTDKLNIKQLDIKTTSGKISFGGILGNNIENVFIKNEKGTVETGDLTTDNFSFITSSGRAKFNTLYVRENCQLQIGNGEFAVNNLIADASVQIENGYLDINKAYGNIDGNDATQQMKGASVTINEVNGNVSLPFVNNARINIKSIKNGKLYVRGTTGSVNVEDMQGYAWIEMTTGSVSIKSNTAFEIVTSTGKIDASITGATLSKPATIKSEKGEINLGLSSSIACKINATFANGTTRDSNNVSIEGITYPTFPLQLNNGTVALNLTTDSRINIYTIKTAA